MNGFRMPQWAFRRDCRKANASCSFQSLRASDQVNPELAGHQAEAAIRVVAMCEVLSGNFVPRTLRAVSRRFNTDGDDSPFRHATYNPIRASGSSRGIATATWLLSARAPISSARMKIPLFTASRTLWTSLDGAGSVRSSG